MRSLSGPDKSSNLTIGFIPARWHSSRFEGKPLAKINGIPMIRRVYDRALMAKNLDSVVVLTDDERINDYCSKREMRCIVIEDECRTGTDRCAKAIELVDGSKFVNIQGDEPLINPEAIDTLIEIHNDDIGVSNAFTKVQGMYKQHDTNIVKVVKNKLSLAQYFSRLPIPFAQKEEMPFNQQMGLYCFSRKMLEIFPRLDVGALEKAESVEMLRFLESGYDVQMVRVEDEGLSVDTMQDLKRVEEFLNAFN